MSSPDLLLVAAAVLDAFRVVGSALLLAVLVAGGVVFVRAAVLADRRGYES